MSNLELIQQWLHTTTHGQYTLSYECAFYHTWVKNIFGYHALQIGHPQINFLHGNKIKHQCVVDHDIKCNHHLLPFANNSIDLIVCSHVLECDSTYYQFLQECYRILAPQGKLIISSFNSSYLFRYFVKSDTLLSTINHINLNLLKQQLQDLNFKIVGGKFFCYQPMFHPTKTVTHFNWIDKIGDRWLPTFAQNFGLIVMKSEIMPTIIMPSSKRYIKQTNAKLCPAYMQTNIHMMRKVE